MEETNVLKMNDDDHDEYLCKRLDFSIEFNIIGVEKLKKSEINNVAMMTVLENNINLKKNGLTLKIKVKHQVQVTDFGVSEILNLENVRIDTKIESPGIQRS